MSFKKGDQVLRRTKGALLRAEVISCDDTYRAVYKIMVVRWVEHPRPYLAWRPGDVITAVGSQLSRVPPLVALAETSE